MKYNLTNLQRNSAFYLILLVGIFYTFFLFVALEKTFSGFIMQIIFFLEAIKTNPSNLFHLTLSYDFILNTAAGSLILYLLYKFLKGFYISFQKLFITRLTLKHLPTIQKKKFLLITIKEPLAFTGGLLNPKVYLSEGLFSSQSRNEVNAVLFHELYHKKNLDPLKDFIVALIKAITPFFPFKDYLFNFHSALVEVNCDQYALSHISKKSLISALLKLKTESQLFLNYFSAEK